MYLYGKFIVRNWGSEVGMMGRHIFPNIFSDFNFQNEYLYLSTLTLGLIGCYENQSGKINEAVLVSFGGPSKITLIIHLKVLGDT